MSKLKRRQFLQEAASALLPDGTSSSNPNYIDYSNKTLPTQLGKAATGLSEYKGSFGDSEILHLCRRTLFGVKKSDVDFFKTKSMNEAVDFILNINAVEPSFPLNHYGTNTNLPDTEVPYGQTWVNASLNGNLNAARIQSFKAWWISLMLNQDRNIREKMTLFWHNHFSTETNVVKDARYVFKNNSLLRSNCLGDFKALVIAISTDPAMLVYLNGEQNNKTSPDENFGRELQELFTVGKDLPNHYTEDDVKMAAKVMTGWRNNATNISSYFDSTKHDTSNKQFSSFYSNTLLTGRTGTTAGAQELNDLVSMIFAQDEVSKFICRKIYRYFVYYVIDETVELNVIQPLAKIFRDNNYQIAPVLSTLFKSEHFYDVLNRGCIIKQPMDYLIGMSRQFNLQFPDGTNPLQTYTHWAYVQQVGLSLGQDIGDPPNVAGWPAFYEDPQYYELWINSDSLPKRNQICDSLNYTGFNRQSFKLIFDLLAFAQQFNTPEEPNALISQITKLLYGIDVSQTVKDGLKTSFLLSGQSSDHYWTDAWNAYTAAPTDSSKKSTVNSRLQALIKYVCGQAEHQLC